MLSPATAISAISIKSIATDCPATMLLLLLRSLFHAFQQPGEIIEVAGINFQVKQITVTVKQFIRWESVNTKMALDGGLLLWDSGHSHYTP